MELRSIPQLTRWLWRTGRGFRFQSALNAILGVLLVVTDLAFVWATKLTIDIATGANPHYTLSFAISLIIAIVVCQLLLGIASKWVRAVLGVRACNEMRGRLFHRLLMARWQPLRRFHTGNLVNRLEQDVNDVVTFSTENIPALLTTVLQFTGAFLLLFWMDRTLACIVVVVLPIFLITGKLYMRRMRHITHNVRDTESRLQAILQESLQHSLVVKTLEQVDTIVARLHGGQQELYRHILRKTRYSTFSTSLMNFGFAAGYVITFTWGVVHLQKGMISYGSLIAFVQLVGQIQAPVRALTRFIPVFIGAFTAAERLMDLERVPVEQTLGHRSPQPFRTPAVGIAVSHLRFSYTSRSRLIFDDFSYLFPPGSVTAIVGETGSGKTTLIRHLLALVEPTGGRICLYPDGEQAAMTTPMEKTALARRAETLVNDPEALPITPSLRTCFSYVPQGNTLLSGTIRQNLLLGNPEATEEEMCEALRAAAADFVFDLPDGLDMELCETGVGLSEGQAQRVSIARALLRPAPILLLDEATSALDAETEQTVIRNILHSHRHRTLLFVTHRPEVLKHCSQILRLEKHNCTITSREK